VRKYCFKIVTLFFIIITLFFPSTISQFLEEPNQLRIVDQNQPDNNIFATESNNYVDNDNIIENENFELINDKNDQTGISSKYTESEFSKSLIPNALDLSDILGNYQDMIGVERNPDGSITAEFFMKPVFYCDEKSNQQFIDTTIKTVIHPQMDMAKDFEYGCEENNLKLYFQDRIKPEFNDELILMANNEHKYPITWQPLGSSVQIDNINSFSIIRNLNCVDAKIDNYEIVFPEIFNGCDDTYKVLPNKLKHELLLKQHSQSHLIELLTDFQRQKNNIIDENNLVFDYYGLLTIPEDIILFQNNILQPSTFEQSCVVELRNNFGDIIYQIPEPFAYELENPSQRIQNKYIFRKLDSSSENEQARYLLILRTNLEWLMNENRNFPIIIDPDIEVPPKGEIGTDTFLVKGNDTHPEYSRFNYGESGELKVSLAGPSVYSKENLFFRSILRFPGLEVISSHAQILDAKLILQSITDTGTLSITVFKLYDNWIEGKGTEEHPGLNGATWNYSGYNIWAGGNYDGDNIQTDTVEITTSTYYSWNVRDIVSSWIANPGTNYGFLLTGTDNEDILKSFYSSEAPYAPVRPKLTVTYNTPPKLAGLKEIIINEGDKQKVIPMSEIFFDPDIEDASHQDSLSFQIWNGTYKPGTKKKVLNFESNGVFSSENITVDLRSTDELYITPSDSEISGMDVIYVRVKDRYVEEWLHTAITIYIKTINDPPEIISIDRRPIYDDTIELTATENMYVEFEILVEDPDNPEFFDSNKYIKNRSHGAPADLEFRWEKEKTDQFTITELEDMAQITFNPDNSLVGLFYINITVYDNYWYKPTKYSKLRKVEVSNHTVMLIFDIENVNNQPNLPKVLEPFEYEFNAEELITFKAKCKDPDQKIPDSNEKLTFTWTSNLDGQIGIGEEIESQLSKGKHIINLTVKDRQNAQNNVSFEISIRNRATISSENCSYHFTDAEDDVLFFYYELADTGEKEFVIERGSNYPEFDLFIDITELTSVRYKNYLLINLTFKDPLSLNLDSKNYKYNFQIHLIKPGHSEILMEVKELEYDPHIYDLLYSPDISKYYAKFGLSDSTLENRERTISIRKHLGDLEYGEGINTKLLSDFTLYAIAKTELKQHPADSFEHVVCYDTIGVGSKEAPLPKQKTDVIEDVNKSSDINWGFISGVLVICIIILVSIVFFFRKKKMEAESMDKSTIDTTGGMDMGMGMPMGVGAPQQMHGPGMMFPPPGPGMPGMTGISSIPGIPGMPGMFPGVQHGPGPSGPMPPLLPPAQFDLITSEDEKKKKKRMFKNK
jgi:hypothetical protein